MSKLKENISIVDLKKEYKLIAKDIHKNINKLLATQKWVLSGQVSQLEEKVAECLKVKYACAVGSGTDALLLSLRAIALIKKGKEFFDQNDEIITTPLTFLATAEAILRSNAKPVFVDIDPNTFNIDPNQIKKAINKNTVGIIPVHLYGLSCNMQEISNIAKEAGLFIVEDCAQSFGAECIGKKTGSFGDCGAFSFFPSKNLGGWGDGGMLVTNNFRIKQIATTLRNHGQTKLYYGKYLGYNSRLDSIQAAVLLAKLKYIARFNQQRQKIAYEYNKFFSTFKQVEISEPPENYSHVYHLYTIKIKKKRNALLKFLNQKGIGSRIYYPFPLYKMPVFKNRCRVLGKTNCVETIVKQIISIPLHPFLNQSQINYIFAQVNKFFKISK